MSEELWKDIERQVDDAPHTPQAHGDALADFTAIVGALAFERPVTDDEHEKIQRIYQALASAPNRDHGKS